MLKRIISKRLLNCSLNRDQLMMLFYLFNRRCLSERSSKALSAMKRDLSMLMDVKAVTKSLATEGISAPSINNRLTTGPMLEGPSKR